MKNSKFTYQKSGVNISEADKFVNFISKNTGKKKQRNKNIGSFGSISNIPKYFKDPKIVASADGVGTKVEIANELNISLSETIVVGDSLRDLEAAKIVGAQPNLVLTGKGEKTLQNCSLPAGTKIYRNLSDFTKNLLL